MTAQGSAGEARPIDNGGQAFPCAGFDGPDRGEDGVKGMTLRDYFAIRALPIVTGMHRSMSRDNCAKEAYRYADAMIQARKGGA